MAYTNQMIEKIEKAQPLNLAIAKELASDLGVTYRSIISKAKQMGFTYQAKAPAMKKDTTGEVTKADLLASIRATCDLTIRQGDLTKAELLAVAKRLSA